MSTKTIAVLNEADISDGQMKEVAFEEGWVLISKIGDKIHATSAFCTHYGAPLAKGVLTSAGRVVCPWHGACFNVCTGDIEDAPALDSLHSFKAHVSDGKIFVTGNPSNAIKANKTRPLAVSRAALEAFGPGVVIVGGGSGAIYAVQSLRENEYKGTITIISAEPYAPVDRTKLSKMLVGDPAKVEWRNPADLKIRFGVSLRTGVSVTAVDTAKKTVSFGEGESITYEHLILAPGSEPRRLPVEGANLGNVLTLRQVENAKSIDAAAKEGKRLVVIGSSFISIEIVNAVLQRKLASIDVIGMEEFPFEAVLGKEVGGAFLKHYESKGVKFHMQYKVEKIIPSEEDANVAAKVVIADGPTLDADFVVMGVGVTPATTFLKNSGFALEKDGGIKVDEYLRVPGHENVYAIGDIAHFPQAQTGGIRRIEHWNVAGNHGRAVGRSIAGKGLPFEKVPVFWSAQGLRYAGIDVGFEEVIIRGKLEEMKFAAFYVKGDRVVAVSSLGMDPLVMKASELFKLGLMPSAEEVRNGKDLLAVDISSFSSKPVVA